MATSPDYEIVIEKGLDIQSESGVKIIKIEPGSLLSDSSLEPGDSIVRINGRPVRDLIDFHFAVGGESELVLSIVKKDGTRQRWTINKNEDESLGLEFETFKYQHCGNNCIFCFVNQNPSGMRRALYFKDEDYRLSFLWGNFTTLTNTSQKDLHRIVEQRLAPLYVSVHATEPALRQKLLGIRRDDKLMEKLEYLSSHHIEMHGQIVLCPGINDGRHLKKTCLDLLRFYPSFNTLAVVPLGLTRYRENLTVLTPVTPEYAREFIQFIETIQNELAEKGYEDFLYLADEWYLRAGKVLPPYKYYGRFPQIENGVGIVRRFLKEFTLHKKRLPSRMKRKKKIHLMTSVSAAKYLQKVAKDCEKQTKGLEVVVHPTINHFYGEMITVSGLLTGQDFLAELKGKELGDLVLLPPDCVKQDEDIFLDDMTVKHLSKKLNRPVIACRNGAEQMIDEIISLNQL